MTFQSRDQTPRDGPETHSSKPIGYPFKLKAAASILLSPEVGRSSFLRTCHWGGCSKIFVNDLRLCCGCKELRFGKFVLAPAEDKALRGRNLSAAWSGINGRPAWPCPCRYSCKAKNPFLNHSCSFRIGHWRQVPIKTPDSWCAQRRTCGAFCAPIMKSAAGRGITVVSGSS
jgi:hypothetical protein